MLCFGFGIWFELRAGIEVGLDVIYVRAIWAVTRVPIRYRFQLVRNYLVTLVSLNGEQVAHRWRFGCGCGWVFRFCFYGCLFSVLCFGFGIYWLKVSRLSASSSAEIFAFRSARFSMLTKSASVGSIQVW